MKSLKIQSLTGTVLERGAGETVLYSSALVRNDRMGTRLPEVQMTRGRAQALESSECHDPLQGRLGPDMVTQRSCNQTRVTAEPRGGHSEDNQLGFLSSLSLGAWLIDTGRV